MIEKLKTINPYDETEIDMDVNSVAGFVYENTPLVQKINELVDAVNALIKENNIHEKQIDELQMKVEPAENPTISKMEKVDPYAEQRKWVGKLCRFWDEDDKDCFVFGILDRVDTNRQNSRSKAIYFDSESAGWWEHCEPVKPDDDIIYKGGDNDDR